MSPPVSNKCKSCDIFLIIWFSEPCWPGGLWYSVIEILSPGLTQTRHSSNLTQIVINSPQPHPKRHRIVTNKSQYTPIVRLEKFRFYINQNISFLDLIVVAREHDPWCETWSVEECLIWRRRVRAECQGMRYLASHPGSVSTLARDAIISGICSLLTLIAISSYFLTLRTLDAARNICRSLDKQAGLCHKYWHLLNKYLWRAEIDDDDAIIWSRGTVAKFWNSDFEVWAAGVNVCGECVGWWEEFK